MLINQNELEKLCKYLYPKFFDYKDISLYDLNIQDRRLFTSKCKFKLL